MVSEFSHWLFYAQCFGGVDMAVHKVFYRAPHNYDWKAASDEAAAVNLDPSMTVQSMAEDVDLNVIMRRFGVTGKMPEDFRPMAYGDFSEVFDFRSAQNALIDARERFMSLPAEVRARFGNDPQLLLEFCENPGNIDELRKMGLARVKEDSHVSGTSSVVGGAGAPAGSGSRGDAQAAGRGSAASSGPREGEGSGG